MHAQAKVKFTTTPAATTIAREKGPLGKGGKNANQNVRCVEGVVAKASAPAVVYLSSPDVSTLSDSDLSCV